MKTTYPDGTCFNHRDRPVKAPSKVLCADCLEKLNAKFQSLSESLNAPPAPGEVERDG